ncbi:MAG TPA: hypothetical protein VMA74_20335 [Dyella sp.]|uniref:hypothetical protein n=1 Tax=Dyella sp. TaxID=1869338 RepID=UPI002C7891A2|nr:hypothetical protein [Dyella sp.]HUB92083.1 hypothetical protein [Dyella sp.]
MNAIPEKPGAEAIRAAVMQRHTEVRHALREVVRLVSRAGSGNKFWMDELRASLQQLTLAVQQQSREQQRLLDPFLQTVDAWGAVRVERLQKERELEAKLVQSACDQSEALADAARAIVRPLIRLLRREEREALAADVLRDDAIVINQQDG